MVRLLVGVGQVTLLLRQAKTLKEKRNVTHGLTQKLKNRGFTVTECGFRDDARTVVLGFAYVGDEVGEIEVAFDKILPLFFNEYEIVDKKREIIDAFAGDEFDVEGALENDPREPY